MASNIMETLRITCNIEKDCEDFDDQLIEFANDAFAKLNDAGVGPDNGFFIEDKSEEWIFYADDRVLCEIVKTFVSKSVRLAFDPPGNSMAKESIKECIDEAFIRAYGRAQHYYQRDSTIEQE